MKKLMFAFVLCLSSNADACFGRLIPNQDLAKYSQIFIGQISSSHFLKVALGPASADTQSQNLTVVVTKVFVGNPKASLKVRPGDCLVDQPKPMTSGIFFVNKEDGQIISIFESEGERYQEWVAKASKLAK
ncbi:hypothetical protein [Undibacterium flavidum]|uniref:Tissue inhibitor of metalloproteinase n=1 Tax=Undibacterium flavidum TaxID=2762297 RepID=A0ABR6YAA6_9BURK|nr:hypothetical protein [Undibacterium flavidum]MBC3873565.1 hypothetical protein [Undibacterium flavidum]